MKYSLRKILIVFFLSFLLFQGCAGKAPVIENPNRCSYLQKTEKPSWINGSNHFKNFYSGMGQAEKQQGGFQAQLNLAKKHALADLSENIKVNVHSEFHIENIIDTSQNINAKKIKQKIKTASIIELNDISDTKRWLDQENCILWCRIKIKKQLVDNLIELEKSENIYQKALSKSITPEMRIKNINDAIILLNNIDFSQLPAHHNSKAFYLKKYRRQKEKLAKNYTGKNMIFIVNAPQNVAADFKNEVVTKFMAKNTSDAMYLKDYDCSATNSCLEAARDFGAQNLALININKVISKGSMGMYKGELDISIAVYDVGAGELKTDLIKGQGQIFSFEKDNIKWSAVLAKIFDSGVYKPFIERD